MSAVPRPTICISPVVPADFPSLARAELAAMEDDWLYKRLYPAELRPSLLEQRIGKLSSPFRSFARSSFFSLTNSFALFQMI